MKRVLTFSLAYYPSHVSGAEAAVKEITDRIAREDIAFDVITLRFDKRAPLVETIGNVRVYRVMSIGSGALGKLLFPFLAAIGAARLHKKNHYNALWGVMTYMLLPTVLARTLGVRLPYVVTLQDGDTYEKVFNRIQILPFIPLINYGFRKATVIQAISSYLATWPAKRGSTQPVEIIHNGANPRDLHGSVSPQEIEEVKKKLGKKEGDVFLINTARLVHQKAQDDVIRALPMLPAHIRFVVVGDGPEKEALQTLSQELSLGDRVLFVGHVEREKISAYRKASDIFVAPSRSEGLGNAFLSAMASRLPVIATQEGGLADFIFDTKHSPHTPATAWVVEKNSPKQIADAVQDILAHPEEAAEVTSRAHAMVLQGYDWDTIARDMRRKIFSKVV